MVRAAGGPCSCRCVCGGSVFVGRSEAGAGGSEVGGSEAEAGGS